MMLDSMTARQAVEFFTYINMDAASAEEARVTAQESNLKAWFSRKIKQQKKK